MSKNKFFKFFCFIFLFFFFQIHTVFAAGNGGFTDSTDAPITGAETLQQLGQKDIIASSKDLGKFYFGQNETVLKEQERKFNSIFYHNTPMNCLPLSFQDVT